MNYSLSRRACHLLLRNKISTLSQLAQKIKTLTDFSGLGPTIEKEIQEKYRLWSGSGSEISTDTKASITPRTQTNAIATPSEYRRPCHHSRAKRLFNN